MKKNTAIILICHSFLIWPSNVLPKNRPNLEFPTEPNPNRTWKKDSVNRTEPDFNRTESGGQTRASDRARLGWQQKIWNIFLTKTLQIYRRACIDCLLTNQTVLRGMMIGLIRRHHTFLVDCPLTDQNCPLRNDVWHHTGRLIYHAYCYRGSKDNQ